MNSLNAIQKELQDLRSSLPLDNKQPVFTVPDSYFENFAASVMAKLKDQHVTHPADEIENLSPMLAAISKISPFTVPENYFSDLPNHLPHMVSEDPVPNLLVQHSKQMPYAVPTGYFNQLPAQIAQKVKPAAPVVSLSARWMRYAAAAVIGGVAVIGSIFYMTTGKGNTAPDPALQTDAWMAKKLEDISNKELDDFINVADVSFNGQHVAQTNNRPEVRSMLRDVSDKELDAFLEGITLDNSSTSVTN